MGYAALAMRPSTEYINAMIDNISSLDWRTARQAIAELGKLQVVAAVPYLINALENQNFLVREAAAIALGMFRDQRAVKPLVNLLSDEESPLVSIHAAVTLGRIGGAEAVLALIALLENDLDECLCYTTIEALGNTGDPSAIPAIQPYVNDERHHVAKRAAIALKKLEQE